MKQFFGIILFLSFLQAAAQPPRPTVTNFTPKNYGPSQTPENYCIFQDNRGFIFAGNSGGLLMFDGISWTFIEVQRGSYVTAIDQADDGRIYAATNNGEFGYLDINEKGLLQYHSLSSHFGKTQALSWTIRLYCSGTGIYLQTTENLFYIDSAYQVKNIPTETSFHLIFKTGNTIYARERGVGLITINGTEKKVLSDIPEFRNYGLLGCSSMITTNCWSLPRKEDYGCITTKTTLHFVLTAIALH